MVRKYIYLLNYSKHSESILFCCSTEQTYCRIVFLQYTYVYCGCSSDFPTSINESAIQTRGRKGTTTSAYSFSAESYGSIVRWTQEQEDSFELRSRV